MPLSPKTQGKERATSGWLEQKCKRPLLIKPPPHLVSDSYVSNSDPSFVASLLRESHLYTFSFPYVAPKWSKALETAKTFKDAMFPMHSYMHPPLPKNKLQSDPPSNPIPF